MAQSLPGPEILSAVDKFRALNTPTTSRSIAGPTSAPSTPVSNEIRVSNNTPPKFANVSSGDNEGRDSMDIVLRAENAYSSVFEVETDTFIDTFLYPPSVNSAERKRYKEVAKAVLNQLAKGDGFPIIDERTSRGDGPAARTRAERPPLEMMTWTDDEGISAISACTKEEQMYAPLRSLLNAIQHEFGKNGLSGDEHWTSPVQPAEEDETGKLVLTLPAQENESQTPPVVLARTTVECHDKVLQFAHTVEAPPGLKVDLALLMKDPDDPKPENPERAPIFWKDVKVPIEIKDEESFDSTIMAQLARYARAVKLDQFDRNFSFLLFINQKFCRLLRWDTSACYMTAPINYHEAKGAKTFIELYGRLCSLEPAALGYDLSYSNAGRVSACAINSLNTTLTIRPTLPRKLTEVEDGRIILPKASPVPDLSGPAEWVFYLTEEKIHQDRGGNFCRSTVVWNAVELTDDEDRQDISFVIKQHHQDDRREHEASFYTEANEIMGVAHLVCFEELDHTRKWHNLPPESVHGCLSYAPRNARHSAESSKPHARAVAENANNAVAAPARPRIVDKSKQPRAFPQKTLPKSDTSRSSQSHAKSLEQAYLVKTQTSVHEGRHWKLQPTPKQPEFERALLRLVFRFEGYSLKHATNAKELMSVSHDCLKALKALRDRNILHRDISYGNLLMTRTKDGQPVGIVIDLGLATFLKNGKETDEADNQPRHHLTGTIPYMARDMLPEDRWTKQPAHTFSHDIESLFWVILWLCLKCEPEPSWAADSFQELLKNDPTAVRNKKTTLLAKCKSRGPGYPLCGKYSGGRRLLEEFARLLLRDEMAEEELYEAVDKLFDDFKAGKLDSVPPSTPKRLRDEAEADPSLYDVPRGADVGSTESRSSKKSKTGGVRSQP